MLFLRHVPLTRQSDTLNNYLVSATIIACSGTSLMTDSLKIYYSVDGGSWEYTFLADSSQRNSYNGHIPARPPGSQISYYLKAADYSDRVETHPYIGEPWAHEFAVNIPPEIISADSFACEAGEYFAFYPQFTDADDSVHTISYSDYPAWLSVENDSLVGTAPDNSELSVFNINVSDGHSSDSQDITLVVYSTGYAYLPGDANMLNGQWPPQVIGGDVTYMVNFFRGIEANQPCFLNGFWASADVNGDCNVIGSDVTRLVNYFRGINNIEWCPEYEPLWPSPEDIPVEAPGGWPNCEAFVYRQDTQIISVEIEK
jgi:hypothetical protein